MEKGKYRLVVASGIIACVSLLPPSIYAISVFAFGLLPTVLILMVLTFLVYASKKMKNRDPFTKRWYLIYFVASVIGLAVAWPLFIASVNVFLNGGIVADEMLPIRWMYYGALFAPVFGTYTLVRMSDYQKSTKLPNSSPPPVQPQQAAQVQPPQTPAPPSDTPTPQS